MVDGFEFFESKYAAAIVGDVVLEGPVEEDPAP